MSGGRNGKGRGGPAYPLTENVFNEMNDYAGEGPLFSFHDGDNEPVSTGVLSGVRFHGLIVLYAPSSIENGSNKGLTGSLTKVHWYQKHRHIPSARIKKNDLNKRNAK